MQSCICCLLCLKLSATCQPANDIYIVAYWVHPVVMLVTSFLKLRLEE